MCIRTLILLFISMCPLTTYGAVVINEIAWMGTAVNANDEWIELYNNGSESVSLDGWILSDGVSLSIALTGAVGAGEYALLERTDDETVPGKTAFLIYTGALSNDGRTLTLKRGDTSAEDVVVGGTVWEDVGGNNVTKDTAQRTSSSWITGAPTPGVQNVSVDSSPEESTDTTDSENNDSEESNTTLTTKSSTNSSSRPPQPIPNKLSLKINAPSIAYVNQPITLTSVPEGLGKTIIASLVHTWNFGDGYTGGGKETTYSYVYPGTYVVVLNATYAKHNEDARKVIEVLPVTLALSRDAKNNIQIQNTSNREMDISGFTLSGRKSFTFPKNSILLPQGKLTISAERLEAFDPSLTIVLRDTKNSVVTQDPPAPSTEVKNTVSTNSTIQSVSKTTSNVLEKTTVTDNEEVKVVDDVGKNDVTIPLYNTAQTATVIGTDMDFSKNMPYFGLVGIIGIGILLLYFRRSA